MSCIEFFKLCSIHVASNTNRFLAALVHVRKFTTVYPTCCRFDGWLQQGALHRNFHKQPRWLLLISVTVSSLRLAECLLVWKRFHTLNSHCVLFFWPVTFWRIHPLQSWVRGNPPARGWRSVALLGSTCFPRGKVCVERKRFVWDIHKHVVTFCIIIFF